MNYSPSHGDDPDNEHSACMHPDKVESKSRSHSTGSDKEFAGGINLSISLIILEFN
jgi:hypothetical protein